MQTWSRREVGYAFGPFGPLLTDLVPGFHCKRVLDLGCGDGSNTTFLCGAAEEVWGVDKDPAAIARAMGDYPRVNFVIAQAEEFLEATPLVFDAVVCSRLLGFVPDLYALLSPLKKRLHGHLLISDWHPMACWVTPDGSFGMDYSATGCFAPGQYHHTISDVTNALIDCGFQIAKVVEGPARRHDTFYREAPPVVQGLPLTMTWICKTPAGADEGRNAR